MKLSKTFLLIITLFLFVSIVFAQQTSYEIITHKDELYGKPISSIIFDSDGKLWMGGTGEVSRLDGDKWMTYKLNEELSDKNIYPKAVNYDGVILFTTDYPDKKIYLFDGETVTSNTLSHEGITIFPDNVVIDTDGVVWAGGGYGVIFYYKDDIWTKTIVDFALRNVITINDLAVDSDGVVYAATNGGVYMYKTGKWINTYGPDGMEEFKIGPHDAYTVTVGPDGKVWAGTNYGEVSCFDGETWSKITEFTEIQEKVWKVWSLLSTLIDIWEKDYFLSKGEYINFEFGEDCESIGWHASYDENFEYSFQDSIAIAREKEDVNGDGDIADGLTLSVTNIEGILAGSDITWEDRYGAGPSGYMITHMEIISGEEIWINVLIRTGGNTVFLYDDGTWIQYTADEIPDDKPKYLIGIAPDGVVWIRTEKGIWQLVPTSTIVEMDESIPSEFAITGNYPNPFNPTTTIEFTIPETGHINLGIYNITGQKILELIADTMPAGTHSVVWDGKDDNGKMVSTGIYISSLKSGGNVTVGKMLLMK